MNPNQPARAGVRRAHSCRQAGIVVTIAISMLVTAAPRLRAQAGGAPAGRVRDLVAIDFAKAPLGAPPAEIRVLRGKFEVVNKDGTRMLRCSEEGAFLLMVPEKIPNKFALEFDLVPKFSGETNTTELSFEGTREVSHSEESAHVHWSHHKVSVIGGGQTYAGGQIDLPEDLREEVIGNLTKIRAEFEGSNLTVTTNGRQVFESKIAKFNRGRVVRVSLGGTDEGDSAVYLASVRMTSLDAGSGGNTQAVQQDNGAARNANPPGKTSNQQQQIDGAAQVDPTDAGTDGSVLDQTTEPGQTSTNTAGVATQEGSGTAETTAPATITGLVAQVNEFGGAWANWDYVPGAVSCFTVCWNTADPYGPKFTSSPDHPPGTGMQIGVLTAAGTYGFRVYAKTATGVVTGETQFQFAGAANQQAGTTVSSPPSTGSTSEEAAITEVTGIAVNVAADGNVRVSWDMAEDALSYFAICWDREITRSFQLASPPEFLSNAWEVGVLPAAGDYAVRVFCKLQSGGYVAGEAMFTYGGAANQQAGTTTGGTQPSSTGSSGKGTTAGADTRVVLRVNSDGGAVGMWDAVPDAISYVPVLWNATDQNAAPWVTSSQDFNNARMLPGSNSTGWQIGILPSQGTYVLRVYATTASGGVASGETQVNFTGASNEQAGTIEAATPATDTAVVFNINSDGGAWATWDPVPGAISYFAIVWNATNQNVMPWVTNSQDFKNARMLPDTGSTGWQIGILPSPGPYVFRVYAKTADGYAVGEAQAQFSGAATQQTGTNGTGATGGSVQDPGAQTGQVVQTGSYKVTVTGLSVYNPTNEDPSISDGAGDEALVCAVVTYMDRTTSSEISFGQIQSVDYGDVADGRYAGRVRAGRASQTGGLRGQDVVPDGFDPAAPLSGTPQPEHLPLIMWEGSLTAGREIVILIPSVWEHDGARDAVNSYFNNWQACSRSELLSSLPVQASLSDGRIGASEAVFFPEILNSPAATSFATPPWTGYKLAASAFKAGVDRPIGFESMPGEPDTLKFGERFVVITQEKIASLQVGQAITVPVRFTESTGTSIGGGDYRVFVRVERTE